MQINKSLSALTALFLVVSVGANSADNNLYLGNFSHGKLDNWVVKEFAGKTQYSIVNDSEDKDKLVLKAQSNKTASGLFVERKIDLNKTPYLHWSWKTDKLYLNLDESSKKGDDFVARIYIVIDGGVFFGKPWRSTMSGHPISSKVRDGQIHLRLMQLCLPLNLAEKI